MTELPPLPESNNRTALGFPAYTAGQMRDYGRQCVEAYKASLKPVTWERAVNGTMIPLYRLDDQP
jgi:hypothetical protein